MIEPTDSINTLSERLVQSLLLLLSPFLVSALLLFVEATLALLLRVVILPMFEGWLGCAACGPSFPAAVVTFSLYYQFVWPLVRAVLRFFDKNHRQLLLQLVGELHQVFDRAAIRQTLLFFAAVNIP